MKSKVTIVSNGGLTDTRIYVGQVDITHLVAAVRWSQESPGHVPMAELELFDAPIDTHGCLERMRDQQGRQIKRIIFSDGTELSTED